MQKLKKKQLPLFFSPLKNVADISVLLFKDPFRLLENFGLVAHSISFAYSPKFNEQTRKTEVSRVIAGVAPTTREETRKSLGFWIGDYH